MTSIFKGLILAVATVGVFIVGGVESSTTGVIVEYTPQPTPFLARNLKLKVYPPGRIVVLVKLNANSNPLVSKIYDVQVFPFVPKSH